MSKYILFFISLISISLCGYLPLKKSNGFDDNVCAYKFSSVNYVKTCKEGQICKDIGEETSICEDIPNTITLKTLGEDCKHKFECETGLFCYGGKCTIYDSAIGCSANEEAHRLKDGWVCKIKAVEDYCKYDDVNYPNIDYSPDYSKVCGEITFKTNSLGTNQGTEYIVSTIKSAYIGTVADGKFVQNPKACKSGYALPFYPDDSLKDPSYDNRNKMYLKCVTINDVDYESYGSCTFKYDTDKIYYTNHFDYNYNNIIYRYSEDINDNQFRYSSLCLNNLKTRLEMFSKYIGVFTEDKQKDCAKKENYNEPKTCNDNELRKWLYYYQNPEHYILYYDEKGNDVANYLIQQKYPLYQSSKILNIKYFISLLLLLLF